MQFCIHGDVGQPLFICNNGHVHRILRNAMDKTQRGQLLEYCLGRRSGNSVRSCFCSSGCWRVVIEVVDVVVLCMLWRRHKGVWPISQCSLI